ncbi:hypothetical protein LJR013_003966 [Pseudarthrobacter oxydans]|uniref:hypothetical protein n=1 Tax=Pseudarthrobacter oxydans TaxID=1671 RepID=UPI003ECC4A65
MFDDQPLDLERILDLVGDAMTAAIRGVDPNVAAAEILNAKRPTARELAAARRENQEVHGGGTPEILRDFMAPSPVPEETARLRRMIDDVLVAAEGQLGTTQ